MLGIYAEQDYEEGVGWWWLVIWYKKRECGVDGGGALLMVKEDEGAICVELSQHSAQSKNEYKRIL